MKKPIHGVLLFVLDVLVFLASYSLTNLFLYMMKWEYNLNSIAQSDPIINIGLPLGVILLTYLTRHLYSINPYLLWEELHRIFKAVLTAVVFIFLLLYTLGGANLKTSTALTVILFGLLSPITRYLYRCTMFDLGLLRTKVVIVGMGGQGKRFYNTAVSHKFTTYQVEGYFIENTAEPVEDQGHILGRFDDIAGYLDTHKVDEVIIAIPRATRAVFLEILTLLELRVKTVKFIPDMYGLMTFSTQITDYDRVLAISASHGLLDPVNQVYKRCFDIIFGCLGLILLAPLTAVVWIFVKLDDGGKVFFTQTRIGKGGKPIKIYKFRTMVLDAEERLRVMMESDPKIKEAYERDKKLDNDPRITRVGQWLRKSSLDEFPQFLNVLRGEMSFIGPRPYLPREAKDMEDKYSSIVKIRPGITGLWQATGRNDISFEERLLLDQYYVRNWTVWFDIVLLIKTIVSVLIRRGARG